MLKVVFCMWFNGDVEEVVRFYILFVLNLVIGLIQCNVFDGFFGKEGFVFVVEFMVVGQLLVVFNGGMKVEYIYVILLMIYCDDQVQVDSVWNVFFVYGGWVE